MGVNISAIGMISSLGQNVTDSAKTLFAQEPADLKQWTKTDKESVPVMAVTADLPAPDESLKEYDCRNNRLAQAAFDQIAVMVAKAISFYGAENTGVVAGSSTSGLDATEKSFEHYKESGFHLDSYSFEHQHAMGSLSDFIVKLSGAKGPAYTVSTACSSAAKAMLSAKALIDAGICKAVITGGVDTLCNLTVNGFDALGQMSAKRLNPLSANRSGLNIGEGGALFLLTALSDKSESDDVSDFKSDDLPGFFNNTGIVLKGGGESMDAYHISAPHPDGLGAKLSMTAALKDAGLSPCDISYVNLHGTATVANDAMETKAVKSVLPDVVCSSTKPFTGHCLGASGAVEAAICCISLLDDKKRLPPHVFDGEYDDKIDKLTIVTSGDRYGDSDKKELYFMSNSFAFGGNNCSIIVGRKRGLL